MGSISITNSLILIVWGRLKASQILFLESVSLVIDHRKMQDRGDFLLGSLRKNIRIILAMKASCLGLWVSYLVVLEHGQIALINSVQVLVDLAVVNFRLKLVFVPTFQQMEHV
jgi:hypothetical protein